MKQFFKVVRQSGQMPINRLLPYLCALRVCLVTNEEKAMVGTYPLTHMFLVHLATVTGVGYINGFTVLCHRVTVTPLSISDGGHYGVVHGLVVTV